MILIFSNQNKIIFAKKRIISLNVKIPSSFIRNFSVLYSQQPSSTKLLLSKPLLFTLYKRFMKRLCVNTLSLTQKERLALHTQEFIKCNFQEAFQTKQNLLQNNIIFMTDEGLAENILNQTLTKATFPRFSDTKKNISSKLHVSQKVEIPEAQEKSDFRFIPEILTTSRFAESSNMIEKIIMNSEKPNNPKNIGATICAGNKHKDITLQLQTSNTQSIFEMDVKSGNNANNPFSGILAEIPHITTNQPYCVTNEALSLTNIQKQRLTYFDKISENISENNFKEIYIRIKNLHELHLNCIQKNILIQEEIFKLMSQNLLSQRPSFYHAFVINNQAVLHEAFYTKLEPHINTNIFDNAKNAQKFIKQAIKAYTETIQDISGNITKSKNGWMGTGFENIADDLFK